MVIIAVGLLSFGPVEGNPQTLELPVSGVDVSLNWNTNTLGLICFFILIGITVWFLIELGMLKGTPGPNRFGPDPLGRTDVKLQPAAAPCVDLELVNRRRRFPPRSAYPIFLRRAKFRRQRPLSACRSRRTPLLSGSL